MRRVPVGEGWPGGIGITVTFPRWLLRLLQVGLGLLLVTLLLGAALAIVFAGTTGGGSGSAAFGIGVTGVESTGGAVRVAAEITVGPGDEAYANEGWSLLFADGSISPAQAVSGPARFAGDTRTAITLEFGAREGASPLFLRYDPGGELGLSIPLR